MDAGNFALTSAGCFLLFGMLTGIWKYFHMMTRADAQAPYYVDICHRTSLQYAFACVVLFLLATNSAWSEQVNWYATVVPILFFASAVFTYWLHGVLKDTDNQLAQPHRLGGGTVPRGVIKVYMLALIAGEIGGTAVLLAGYIASY
ncbi:MAG: hypothetical protein CTY21_14110 [Methylomonas sp.]|nr:MAG: hypothetical protein CTY21_14110 [Methylomonas sp.]